MDYKNLTAPCGLDCFNCILFVAGKNETTRKMLAKKMKRQENEVVCKGCRNENGKIPFLEMKTACNVH